MKKQTEIKYTLSDLKNSIIDISLVVGSVFSTLNYAVSTLNKIIVNSVGFSFALESVLILSLFIATFLRRKLSTEIKALIVIFLIIFFSLSDAFLYGIISSARVYLILVPFLSLIYLSPKKSLFIFITSMLLFIFIGFLHHSAVLKLPSSYEPQKYVLFFYPWIINGLHISTVSLVIFFITWKFFTNFQELIIDLEMRNNTIAEKEQNYREIFNSTSEAIFIHDAATGKIIDVNEVMLQMYGFESKDELINTSVSDISANDEPYTEKEVVNYINKTISQGPQLFDWKAKKRNGEIIWIEVSLRNSQIGGQGRVLAVVRDITQRRKTEQALADSEQRFRQMSDLLPQTIIETDVNGTITYLNKIGYQLFKIEEEDILGGINIFSFLDEEQRQKALANFNKTMNGQPVDSNFYNLSIKDGSIFPIQIFSTYFESQSNKGIRAIVVDIRERIEAEKQIRESQQQFMTLAEMSPVGIFRTRPDGYTTYVNPKWTELSGISAEEALGDGWLKAVHPDDRNLLSNKWESDNQATNNSLAEYRFLRPDGTIKWVLGNAIPENMDGVLLGFIGTITDITDIKIALEKLENSEKRFREMADLLPQTVWETDLHGKLTFVNKHGMQLFGYSDEDIERGLELLSTVSPEHRVLALENIQKCLGGEAINSLGEEYITIKSDGSAFPVRVFYSTIKEQDKPIGLRGISFDITYIKKAEKELMESEAKYRTIIEAFPDIIMISDLAGNIIFGNEALTKITGITEKDYSNPERKAHIHPEDADMVSKAIANYFQSNKKHSEVIENRFIDNCGKMHWFSGIISKIILNDQVLLQTITRDITDKKLIEMELEKYRTQLELLVKERTDELGAANEELLMSNEELKVQQESLEITLQNLKNTQTQLIHSEKMASLGILAAGIAHEINNPLNFISGGLYGIESFVKEYFPNHQQDIEPMLKGMQEGVHRAAAIVSSLNHYSRKNDSVFIPCDIHSIIDNCLVMLQNQTKNNIEIHKDYTEIPHTFNGNEGKLHQVFLNVLTNAVHAIADKGKINIKTSIVNNEIYIEIIDSGHGIPEENLNKIFDPFFTTKDPGKGTGLGLSITYNIIKEHKGTIEFNSKPGQGTIVTIQLPTNL